jgi:hypothetical protein
MLLLLLIWTIGVGMMWSVTRGQLPLEGESETPRGWKAVLVLAQAIRQELMVADIDPRGLTDAQLKAEIKKRLHGGAVAFDGPLSGASRTIAQVWKQWLIREKWWFAALVASLSCWTLKLISTFAFVVMVHVSFGVAFAMLVGQSSRSRLIMFFAFSVLGLIVASALSV